MEKEANKIGPMMNSGLLKRITNLINKEVNDQDPSPDIPLRYSDSGFRLGKPKAGGESTDPHQAHYLKYDSTKIPDALLAEWGRMRYVALMGLFPSINRAWITCDNKLLMWNYITGGDYIVYDQQPQCLVAVGLTTPPVGLFHPEITNILVLATPVQVSFVAVGFRQDTRTPFLTGDPLYDRSMGEIKLSPVTPTVPTYDVSMTKIISTPKGRVFMGSQTGCLYECEYTTHDGWDNTKLRLQNHSNQLPAFLQPLNIFAMLRTPVGVKDMCLDEQQGFLYTLLDDSTIEVWDINKSDLKPGGKSDLMGTPSRLACRQHVAGSGDADQVQPILSIHVHQRPSHMKSRSRSYNLVAIRANSSRIFYECRRAGRLSFSSLLQLVATCPALDTRTQRTQIQQTEYPDVQLAFYAEGACLMCDSKATYMGNGMNIRLPGYSPGVPQGQRSVMYGITCQTKVPTPDADVVFEGSVNSATEEVYKVLEDVDGNVLSIDEIPREYLEPHLSKLTLAPNQLATQHLVPPRQFVVLGSQGVYRLIKLRPIDHLHLLLKTEPLSSPLYKAFQRTYGMTNTVCMLLTLLGVAQQRGGATAHTLKSHNGAYTPGAFSAAPSSGLPTPYGEPSPTRRLTFAHDVTPSGHVDLALPGPASPMGSGVGLVSPASAMASAVLSRPTQQVRQQAQNLLDMIRLDPNARKARLELDKDPNKRLLKDADMLEAFMLHFSRIVAPFWSSDLFDPQLKVCSFTMQQLEHLLDNLKGFQAFFSSHPDVTRVLDHGASLDQFNPTNLYDDEYLAWQYVLPPEGRSDVQLQHDAQTIERLLIQRLVLMVDATVQAVYFLTAILPFHLEHLLHRFKSSRAIMTCKNLKLENIVKEEALGLGGQAGVLHEFVKAALDAEREGQADPALVTSLVQRLSSNCSMFLQQTHIKEYQGLDCIRMAWNWAASDPEKSREALERSLRIFKEIGVDLWKGEGRCKELYALCDAYMRMHYIEGVVSLCIEVAARLDPNGAALRWYDVSLREPHLSQHPGEDAHQQVSQCYQEAVQKVLGPVGTNLQGAPPSTIQDTLSKLFERVVYMLRFNIPLWHYAIFDFFCANGLKEHLPKLESQHLERYLQYNRMYRDRLLPELCKYCMRMGKYEDAARYYARWATCDPAHFDGDNRPLKLSTRVSLLADAKNAADLSNNRELSIQLNDYLQVAQVQQIMAEEFNALASSLHTLHHWSQSDKDAMKETQRKVEEELCEATWMYKECQRYGFSMCSLRIIQICHPNEDQSRITKVYEKLLLDARATGTLDQIVGQLVNRFYANSTSRFFPITLIISTLEWDALSRHSDSDLVGVDVLLRHGVERDHVYHGYQKVYDCLANVTVMQEPLLPEFLKMRDSTDDLVMHILQVICQLLQDWFQKVMERRGDNEMREFNLHRLTLSNDIDRYKATCNRMDLGVRTPSPTTLKKQFEQLQEKMQSIVPDGYRW
uniref:Nucleoporin Nup133/Nup155-like N-terminal domain-containing protein n=1 Tax=Eutreptiella gymnastica TaxID=73025 RepID=A0A7S1JBN5_9EUGL